MPGSADIHRRCGESPSASSIARNRCAVAGSPARRHPASSGLPGPQCVERAQPHAQVIFADGLVVVGEAEPVADVPAQPDRASAGRRASGAVLGIRRRAGSARHDRCPGAAARRRPSPKPPTRPPPAVYGLRRVPRIKGFALDAREQCHRSPAVANERAPVVGVQRRDGLRHPVGNVPDDAVDPGELLV